MFRKLDEPSAQPAPPPLEITRRALFESSMPRGVGVAAAVLCPPLSPAYAQNSVPSPEVHQAQDRPAVRPASLPGFEHGYADVNGTRLHYVAGGNPNGEPILLWHGFLGTWWAWRKVAPMLAARGYAVLAPDMRGYGDSAKPDGAMAFDGAMLAQDFRALVQKLGFGGGRPLTLVAHDMGAPCALIWTATYPDEVRALAYIEEPVVLPEILKELTAFSPEPNFTGGRWWWLLPLAPGITDRLIVGREREFLTWFYERVPTVPPAITEEDVNEYLRSFRGKAGVDGAFGVYRGISQTSRLTAPLASAKITTPVLAVGGDKARGVGVAQEIRQVAKNVKGVSIANCAHFVAEEQPAELVQQLEIFLRETPRP
jgi:pimeloyl-ACP methyl ester carboxylesterase